MTRGQGHRKMIVRPETDGLHITLIMVFGDKKKVVP